MFNKAKNILISGGSFVKQEEHHHHGPSSVHIQTIRKSAMDRLMESASLGALHNSGERLEPPKCHPKTRTAILHYLMKWIIGHVGWDIFVLWLYGPAGAGKSAIAQTLAERCLETNILLATFFFCRSDPRRNNDKVLVATLVYQMAMHLPGFWEIVEVAIEHNPAIFHLNFEAQFQTLLVNPLLRISRTGVFESNAAFPYIFIIDGLDECAGSDSQTIILNTISNALQKHRSALPFKFYIGSRPERHLAMSFSTTSLNHLTYQLVLDNTYHPDKDIRLYLTDSLRTIRKAHVLRGHIPAYWPSEEDVNRIVKKSSGQFIYAATVVRYLSSPRHNPVHRLKVIHGLLPPDNDKPYAEIDSLYHNILSSVENVEAALTVLGVHLVIRSAMSVNQLEKFMLLPPGTIRLLLVDLTSIVTVPSTNWEPLRIVHESFTDFIFDATRSLQFYIDPSRMHEEVVRYCVGQIKVFCFSVLVDPTSEIYFLMYAFREFAYHLWLSGPLSSNPALWEEVRTLPFLTFVNEIHRKHTLVSSRTPGEVIKHFLNTLKCSDLWRTEELYLYHRDVWDKAMLDTLSLVPNSPGLAFWIAVCLEPPDSLRYGVYRNTLLALPSCTFSSSDSLLYLPFTLFTGHILLPPHACGNAIRRWSLGMSWVSINADYFALVSEFLGDPSRAGSYAMDESAFTLAAEFIVEFTMRPWDDKKAKIVTGDDSRQWDLIWDALVSVLSRAGRSDKLLKMLNHSIVTFILGCPSYFWKAEDGLRTMWRVVNEYILAHTGTTPPGFSILIDWTDSVNGATQPSTYYIGSKWIHTDVVYNLDKSIVEAH